MTRVLAVVLLGAALTVCSASPAAAHAQAPATSDGEGGRGVQIEFAVGPELGVLTGVKGRVRAVRADGPLLGLDLDAGTLVLWSHLTLSAVVGWTFDYGVQALRPYLTAGAGPTYELGLFGPDEQNLWLHGGVGLVWKPVPRFGVGIEGGMFRVTETELAWGRLYWLYYLR